MLLKRFHSMFFMYLTWLIHVNLFETEWYGLSGLISWGPFAIQIGLLAVVAAVLTAIIAVRLLSRAYGPAAKEAAELTQNAAFLAFFVWKFGHVLFAPAVVWDRPLALLMMNGGTREAAVAVTAATVYLAVKLRRNVSPLLFLDLVSFGAVAAMSVYAAIDWKYGGATTLPWGIVLNDPEYRYHPVSAYTVIVAVVVALLLWARRRSTGTGELFRIATMYTGLGLLVVSFGHEPQPSFLWLSFFQWLALLLTASGIILSLSMHTKREGR